MADLPEKIGELAGQLRTLRPALDLLGKNQQEGLLLVAGLQRDIVHQGAELTKFQVRCEDHWNRLYDALKAKVDKAEIDLQAIQAMKTDVQNLKQQGKSAKEKTWDILKLVLAAIVGSVLAFFLQGA